MADSSHGPASFWTQADALLRKNLTYQKRNIKTNIRLISFPFILCLLLVLIQALVNNELDKPKNKCGCRTFDQNGDGREEKVCGLEYSDLDQGSYCAIDSPPEWPPLLQVPAQVYRAVASDVMPFADLPNESCRRTGSCPVTLLFTGNNHTLGDIMVENMFTSSANSSDVLVGIARNVSGSHSMPEYTNFLDPAFYSGLPLYNLQRQCTQNSTYSVSVPVMTFERQQEIICVEGVPLWRNSSADVNNELYKGYRKGNTERKINEILAAYDFLNTNANNFNVSVWYNSTFKNDTGNQAIALLRVPRSVNLASNAYLQFLKGPGTKIQFDFVKEMPKAQSSLKLDFSSLLGTLFFTWVVIQLFPVVLTSLVYEKQQRLRIMMKMHGLGDGPYWLISYAYFLVVSMIYMLCFVIFGSVVGLKFFTLNDYSIQFVFYFIYINLQISLAFLAAAMFFNVKTATVVGYICVFGTGLLGGFLFQFFVEDTSFPRAWIIVMELYPGFALYRGLYEFAQYSYNGNYLGTDGMRWKNLSDGENGMKDVFIIMVVEWLLVLFVAYYVDKIASSGKRPLFFLQSLRKKKGSSFKVPSLRKQGSLKVTVEMDKLDVVQEREKVEQIILEQDKQNAIVCDNLRKVYPGRDGNPDKLAVKGLSLALPRGECFGMLGPNGAGKTSFINMMIGLTKPSSGTAYVQDLDIQTHMEEIYTSMGAVEESLKSVNLFNGGVADKQAGKYSGGMKRRLSVAISLIGDPKVVYMDEPSTGLDPASRNSLWNVMKKAKKERAIILTTHSMEEAEVLCDRLGIFVDGGLQCIGNPKELKARYGGSYVFTMTTSSTHEQEVETLVRRLSPNASKIYHLSGTQKFELPKHEVRIADVFQSVQTAKSRFTVFAWGLADTTLEDVFIKVARGAQAFNVLS
ncbi:ABC transporter A family member 7 [Morus notabilis]|uniref:ABC transporter A family member 7 n=1 Tax=Morus notabilis TaxID=981085 RepID=W9RR94_9ROSA|nr:ABC transporter A family member 7 [Morus notabilis]